MKLNCVFVHCIMKTRKLHKVATSNRFKLKLFSKHQSCISFAGIFNDVCAVLFGEDMVEYTGINLQSAELYP